MCALLSWGCHCSRIVVDSTSFIICTAFSCQVSLTHTKKGKSQQIKVLFSTLLMKGMEVAEIINFLYIVVNVYCFLLQIPFIKKLSPLFSLNKWFA